MNKDPDIVIESILDSKCQNMVKPITIHRYALLERVESPFVNANSEFSVDLLIPSFYICCSEKEVLRKYGSKDTEQLKQDAFDWADEQLKMNDVPDMIKAITHQMQLLNEASPDAAQDVTSAGKKQ